MSSRQGTAIGVQNTYLFLAHAYQERIFFQPYLIMHNPCVCFCIFISDHLAVFLCWVCLCIFFLLTLWNLGSSLKKIPH